MCDKYKIHKMTAVDLHKLLHFIGYTLACYVTLLTCLHDGLWIALLNPIIHAVSQLPWLAWIETTIQIEKPISIIVYLSLCVITPVYACYSFYSFKRHEKFYQTLNSIFLMSLLLLAMLLFVDSYWLTTIDRIAEMLLAIKAIYFLFLLVLPSTTP